MWPVLLLLMLLLMMIMMMIMMMTMMIILMMTGVLTASLHDVKRQQRGRCAQDGPQERYGVDGRAICTTQRGARPPLESIRIALQPVAP
jgi:hypothetical protein